MKLFGKFIRELRKGKGWTLTKLAAKLEMDSANLSKVENGKRDFNEKKISLLCNIFNLDKGKIELEYFSEKIAWSVFSNKLKSDVLSLAKEKVKCLEDKNISQGKLSI